MKQAHPAFRILFAFLLPLAGPHAAGKSVVQPARTLPLAYDVDVVVVGGSSAGVAAAVEAASEGAKVFLAAPRHYLGDDLCGTLRLWLEPGERPVSPLAKEVFAAPQSLGISKGMAFTYSTDRPSGGVHRDTKPPSKLTDGEYQSASKHSVQYDGDVTITLDLGGAQGFRGVHVMAFQRSGQFEVAGAVVSASDDAATWRPIAEIKNDRLGEGFETDALPLSAAVTGRARYLQIKLSKGPDAERILLGEIIVEPDAPKTPPSAEASPAAVTPMQVKRALDQALLKADVQFLFGCFVTDLLRDENGNLAGIVMANRSGSQAVRAKVILDATARATVARLAGAGFLPYPAGLQTFTRVVVGGEAKQAGSVTTRCIRSAAPVKGENRNYDAVEYTLRLPMKDGSFASFAAADQRARDLTWSSEQVDASETLFQVPPDPVKTRGNSGLDAFRPAGVERLYVLGGCAGVSREEAAKLLRPIAFMDAGAQVGRAAAAEAKGIAKAENVQVAGRRAAAAVAGEIREVPAGLLPRLASLPPVKAEATAVPVIGEYDVLVIGGGTAGAPAGIGAARQGAKTLVVEFQAALGGVGTVGLIGKYYCGNRVGFSTEIDKGTAALTTDTNAVGRAGWSVENKMEWYRRELRKAGTDIWFGALGAGAVVENARVKGAVVATPDGRGVVLARMVIDATGGADVAAAAGATCTYITGDDIAVQGTGLPPRGPNQNYNNTDYTFVDETDIVDIWRAFVAAKDKFPKAYDLSTFIDTRERRQIVGDFMLSPLDVTNNRTHPDTLIIARSNLDTHGFIVHPLYMLKPPDKNQIAVHVPYRCLLPKGLDGILVGGIGMSVHRDVLPFTRMQPDMENQGYAAGVAAAMLVKRDYSTRELDIKALQRHLIEKEILPETVLADHDNFPLPAETLARAVGTVTNNFEGLPVILADTARSMPLLRKAYGAARTADAKLACASILGMLGDATGAETLLAAVRGAAWDEGWSFRGGGQFGACMSPLDSKIIALGRTKDPRAVGPIVEKVRQLDANAAFSHHRAVAMALEALADPRGAQPLAELLQKPGIGGKAVTDIEAARSIVAPGRSDRQTRGDSLRELILARALYRCGDHEGVGEKTLRQFANDLHGHYARHAHAILKERASAGTRR